MVNAANQSTSNTKVLNANKDIRTNLEAKELHEELKQIGLTEANLSILSDFFRRCYLAPNFLKQTQRPLIETALQRLQICGITDVQTIYKLQRSLKQADFLTNKQFPEEKIIAALSQQNTANKQITIGSQPRKEEPTNRAEEIALNLGSVDDLETQNALKKTATKIFNLLPKADSATKLKKEITDAGIEQMVLSNQDFAEFVTDILAGFEKDDQVAAGSYTNLFKQVTGYTPISALIDKAVASKTISDRDILRSTQNQYSRACKLLNELKAAAKKRNQSELIYINNNSSLASLNELVKYVKSFAQFMVTVDEGDQEKVREEWKKIPAHVRNNELFVGKWLEQEIIPLAEEKGISALDIQRTSYTPTMALTQAPKFIREKRSLETPFNKKIIPDLNLNDSDGSQIQRSPQAAAGVIQVHYQQVGDGSNSNQTAEEQYKTALEESVVRDSSNSSGGKLKLSRELAQEVIQEATSQIINQNIKEGTGYDAEKGVAQFQSNLTGSVAIFDDARLKLDYALAKRLLDESNNPSEIKFVQEGEKIAENIDKVINDMPVSRKALSTMLGNDSFERFLNDHIQTRQLKKDYISFLKLIQDYKDQYSPVITAPVLKYIMAQTRLSEADAMVVKQKINELKSKGKNVPQNMYSDANLQATLADVTTNTAFAKENSLKLSYANIFVQLLHDVDIDAAGFVLDSEATTRSLMAIKALFSIIPDTEVYQLIANMDLYYSEQVLDKNNHVIYDEKQMIKGKLKALLNHLYRGKSLGLESVDDVSKIQMPSIHLALWLGIADPENPDDVAITKAIIKAGKDFIIPMDEEAALNICIAEYDRRETMNNNEEFKLNLSLDEAAGNICIAESIRVNAKEKDPSKHLSPDNIDAQEILQGKRIIVSTTNEVKRTEAVKNNDPDLSDISFVDDDNNLGDISFDDDNNTPEENTLEDLKWTEEDQKLLNIKTDGLLDSDIGIGEGSFYIHMEGDLKGITFGSKYLNPSEQNKLSQLTGETLKVSLSLTMDDRSNPLSDQDLSTGASNVGKSAGQRLLNLIASNRFTNKNKEAIKTGIDKYRSAIRSAVIAIEMDPNQTEDYKNYSNLVNKVTFRLMSIAKTGLTDNGINFNVIKEAMEKELGINFDLLIDAKTAEAEMRKAINQFIEKAKSETKQEPSAKNMPTVALGPLPSLSNKSDATKIQNFIIESMEKAMDNNVAYKNDWIKSLKEELTAETYTRKEKIGLRQAVSIIQVWGKDGSGFQQIADIINKKMMGKASVKLNQEALKYAAEALNKVKLY